MTPTRTPRPPHAQPPTHPAADRARRQLRRDRGSASAELVIATPLLLLLILGIVQFALWEHATHLAQAAAAQGLAAARVQGGTTTGGQTETRQVLTQLGSGVLIDPTISAQRTGTLISVTVRGHTEPVLPFLHLPVTVTVTGPVEQFTPDNITTP
jgi:Flp pilus assembly protein TadG